MKYKNLNNVLKIYIIITIEKLTNENITYCYNFTSIYSTYKILYATGSPFAR